MAYCVIQRARHIRIFCLVKIWVHLISLKHLPSEKWVISLYRFIVDILVRIMAWVVPIRLYGIWWVTLRLVLGKAVAYWLTQELQFSMRMVAALWERMGVTIHMEVLN